MSETRRAWTPEKVERLLGTLDYIGQGIHALVATNESLAMAEEQVGEILEKALSAPKDGEAEEVEE